MASFQSKIGWKRARKTENKNHRSVSLLPCAKQQIKKNSKKIPKTKKHRYGFISRQNRSENDEMERKKKINVPFRSYPTRNRKFQNNSKKIQKLKNTITGSFEAKIGRKRPRKTECKYYRFVSFLPGTKQKIQRKQ